MLHLILQLGDQRLAVAAAQITEVLPYSAIQPNAAASIGTAGVVEYRGRTLPVVDLAQTLLGRPTAVRMGSRILIARTGAAGDSEATHGLLAERVCEMRHVAPDVSAPAQEAPGEAAIDGADGIVRTLDLTAVLAERR